MSVSPTGKLGGPPGLGTGLTPGFSEILSHWDQVLQSLDRLSTYTAERAGDGKAACCRTERPLLLGQTPEGSEWQALRKPGGYPCRPAGVSLEARELQVSASLPEERSQGTSRDHDAPVPRSVGFPDGPLPQRALGERPRVLVERLAREEACGVLQLIVNAWREERWKQGLRAKAVLMQNALKSEREKLRRRVALADQVQLKEALRLSFHAWHLEGRHSKALKALPSHVPDRGVTSTALPSSESQVDHDGRLEALAQERDDAVANAAASKTALVDAQQQLAVLKAELARSKAAPAEAKTSDSERCRQLTDLSIRLARSEAREAEAKAFLEQLRRPLERALEALKDEKNVKGTVVHRELCCQLYQLLERLRVEGTPKPKDAKVDSTASTPNLPSSFSLPSLSTASSPSARSRSKNSERSAPLRGP